MSRYVPRPFAVLLGVVVAVVAGLLVPLAAATPLATAPRAAAATAWPTSYGAPSWWRGDCDTDNWTAKARAAGWRGEAAGRLGASYLGIPVCGPRALMGAPNVWWSRGGWGELEWQCVEYAMRFMVQVYGVEPYGANGVDVVRNYRTAQGGGLVTVANGTVGTAPQPGDVVSFASPSNVYGHVAVVASSSVDAQGNGSVRLATQNDTSDGWRTLTVSNWRMAAFGSLTPYGWLHDPAGRGDPSTAFGEGSFVQRAGSVATYRIAGGAPVYLSDWNLVGGRQPVVVLSEQRWAQLPTYPANGTYLRDAVTGSFLRVAGGAALPVTCGTGTSACSPAVTIDPLAVTRAGGPAPWDRLRPTPADGTFLRAADGPTVVRAAGGTLLPIADCSVLAGCPNAVTVPTATLTAYPAAHPTPVDGTSVRRLPSGTWATFSGGRCVVGARPASWVDVGDASVTCAVPPSLAPVTTTTLVQGRPGSLALAATGGTAPYTFSLAGPLASGLSFNSTGTVAGTMPGPFSVTVTVTDSTGLSGTATVAVPVRSALAFATTALPTAPIGRAYRTALAGSGGLGPYAFAVSGGSLPTGLTLAADGTLAGTPRAIGMTTVKVTVTDLGDPRYRASGTLNVAVGPGGGLTIPGR